MGNDSAWYSNVANQCYFNPRSRVGNDLQWFVLGLIELLFQSTFPRGERRDAAFTKVFADNFNPRSRVGNDVRGSVYRLSFANFNPRSRVGNDTKRVDKHNNVVISIHVPAWGTTNSGIEYQVFLQFQSTFPRGERHGICTCLIRYNLFQSTFPRGERQ